MNQPANARTSASLLTLVLAAGTLSGCAVGPDYQGPPTLDMPAAFSAADADAKTAGTRKQDEAALRELAAWWQQFGDAQLTSLIVRAAEGNLDLKIASARIAESRALLGISEANFWPTVNADGSYNYSRFSENSSNGGRFPSGADNDFRAGVNASWEVDVFGRVRRGVEAATADLAAQEELRRDLTLMLAADVARTYTTYRSLQARVLIAQANINSQQESLNLANSRFKAGLSSELDVAQSTTQLANTKAAIPTLQIAARQNLHSLSVLLGKAPAALAQELDETKPVPTAQPDVALGVPSELLRRRPDIRQAERNIAATSARIGVATADLFPQFTIVGSFGFEAENFAKLFDTNSRYWGIGPALRWNIFDFGRINNNIKASEAREQQSVATYEKTVLNALRETEDALVGYAKEQLRYTALTESSIASRRALDLAKAQYQAGTIGYFQVLDAERVKLLVEDSLAASSAVITNNLITIYKSLGGGWSLYTKPDSSETSPSPVAPAPAPPTPNS